MLGIRDMARIVREIDFGDWTFAVDQDGERPYLQVRFVGECATTGERRDWHGRKWFLSPHMTASEIVRTAFLAVMTAIEHEAREEFRWKGRAIFGPHISIERLWEIADKLEVRDG